MQQHHHHRHNRLGVGDQDQDQDEDELDEETAASDRATTAATSSKSAFGLRFGPGTSSSSSVSRLEGSKKSKKKQQQQAKGKQAAVAAAAGGGGGASSRSPGSLSSLSSTSKQRVASPSSLKSGGGGQQQPGFFASLLSFPGSSAGARGGSGGSGSQWQLEQQQPQTRFAGDGVSFRAKLIGVQPVAGARGDKMCKAAMQRLKQQPRPASAAHKQRVRLSVSLGGLRLLDEKSGALVSQHPIPLISYISRDTGDERAFGFVYADPSATSSTSTSSSTSSEQQQQHHFVALKTDKAAIPVMQAIADLFTHVYETKQRSSSVSSSSALQQQQQQQQPLQDFSLDSLNQAWSEPVVDVQAEEEQEKTKEPERPVAVPPAIVPLESRYASWESFGAAPLAPPPAAAAPTEVGGRRQTQTGLLTVRLPPPPPAGLAPMASSSSSSSRASPTVLHRRPQPEPIGRRSSSSSSHQQQFPANDLFAPSSSFGSPRQAGSRRRRSGALCGPLPSCGAGGAAAAAPHPSIFDHAVPDSLGPLLAPALLLPALAPPAPVEPQTPEESEPESPTLTSDQEGVQPEPENGEEAEDDDRTASVSDVEDDCGDYDYEAETAPVAPTAAATEAAPSGLSSGSWTSSNPFLSLADGGGGSSSRPGSAQQPQQATPPPALFGQPQPQSAYYVDQQHRYDYCPSRGSNSSSSSSVASVASAAAMGLYYATAAPPPLVQPLQHQQPQQQPPVFHHEHHYYHHHHVLLLHPPPLPMAAAPGLQMAPSTLQLQNPFASSATVATAAAGVPFLAPYVRPPPLPLPQRRPASGNRARQPMAAAPAPPPPLPPPPPPPAQQQQQQRDPFADDDFFAP
ncbi:Protein disabled [Halotydeus destructor]|nr:Protein disabled [Halotydeus destructor]